VALRNTNHWMRGGSYGWQAAEAGMIGLCWTNTNQNLPPWGAREPRIGNNPIVVAVPRRGGHVVLDMAMSQFSYGALGSYRSRGERLPVPGGFDAEGRLSDDPAAIEDAQRPLPIGYWKGAGLSILLDLVAASLAAGAATHVISRDPLEECDLSQIFIAFDVAGLTDPAETDRLLDAVVAHLHASEPVTPGRPVRYPGEATLAKRTENRALGIPVDPAVWDHVRAM
jgi:3-dehydro-L-gulonate 2-dehydrogenase